MLSDLKMNYNAVSANKASLVDSFKSPETQANEDEKIQNSQAPKLDSIEISSQARAALQQSMLPREAILHKILKVRHKIQVQQMKYMWKIQNTKRTVWYARALFLYKH